MSIRKRIIAATPMICLIIYLAVGYIANVWHPTWVIFVLIPIMPLILGKNLYMTLYPVVCVIAYLVLGFTWGYWHPGWLVFLTIPVYYTLFGPTFAKLERVHCVES